MVSPVSRSFERNLPFSEQFDPSHMDARHNLKAFSDENLRLDAVGGVTAVPWSDARFASTAVPRTTGNSLPVNANFSDAAAKGSLPSAKSVLAQQSISVSGGLDDGTDFKIDEIMVRPGETLRDVATRAGASEDAVAAANPDLNRYQPLMAGQPVKIPPEQLFDNWDWSPSRTGNFVDSQAFYAASGNICPTPSSINGANGVIVGPDNRSYAVTVPADLDPCPPGQSCMGPVSGILDDGPGSGWFTVGSKSGDVKIGDPIELSVYIASAIKGKSSGGKFIGAQSLGSAQTDYMQLRADGSASLVDGTEPPVSLSERPRNVMETRYPPDKQAPDAGTLMDRYQDRRATANSGVGALDVAVGSLEGLNNIRRADLNQSYAAQVVFQENTDGQRRAVINLYQAQMPYDRDNLQGENVRPQLMQLFGVVDVNGEIVVAQR